MIQSHEKYFPVMNRPTRAELKVLGFHEGSRPSLIADAIVNPFVPGKIGLVGVRTNEHRRPLKGEWFLSGAIPEVFKAGCDYEQDRDIVRLCVVETKLQMVEISFYRTEQLTKG